MIIGMFSFKPNELKEAINSNKTTANDVILEYYKAKDEELYYYMSESLKNNKDFKVIVRTKEDLALYMKFFSKYSVDNDVSISFRTHNITSMEIYDIFSNYVDYPFTNNIIVNVDNGEELISYNKFMNMMNPLIKIEEGIKDELSPLEKIIYLYNEIKKKAYKNNVEDIHTLESRLLSGVLTSINNYIVCVGFTKVFNENLRINDIKCSEYNFKGQYQTQDISHSVSLVNIDDDKYDIHGIYVFDLTLDCYSSKLTEEENTMRYKGFLMSFDKFCNLYKVEYDEYSKLFYNPSKKNELYAKYYEQKASEEFVSTFDDKERFLKLGKFISLDYDLFDGVANIDVDENLNMQESMVYKYAEKLKMKMGVDIKSDDDKFINLLYNTSIDSDNKKIYRCISNRGVDNELEAINKVLGSTSLTNKKCK